MGRLIDADRLKAHYAWWGEDSDSGVSIDDLILAAMKEARGE